MQVGEARAAGLALQQAGFHRVVLEDEDLVEQRLAALPVPALDIVQRGVFVLAHGEAGGLHLVQPVADALFRARAGGQRDGVDEQAELAFDARQFRRAPGDGGAEGHAALAGVALQQEQPGRLQQAAEGQLAGAGEAAQLRADGERQAAALLGVAAARLLQDDGVGQAGRLLQVGQVAAPECLAGSLIPVLQPGDVVAVAAGAGRHGAAGIVLQHLGEQLRLAPAVQQQVVAGPDQMVAGAGAHQQQAQQRRLGEIERPALGGGQGVEVVAGAFAQLQRRLAQHGLQRRATGRRNEHAAQRRMAFQRGLPGGAETLDVEIFDIHAHLVDVAAVVRLVEAVEQHALLHRRQRVEIGDLRQRQSQRIESGLVEARQGEVGGRGAAFGGEAVLDQRQQLVAVAVDQLLQAPGVELLRAEGPAEMQAAVLDHAVDAQPVVQRRGGIAAGAGGFAGALEQGSGEAAVELAEVVEGDARRGQRRQFDLDGLRREVAQQAEAEAVVRHLAQLFLDAAQRRAGVAGGAEAQRIDAGEPAHAAAEVEAGELFLAAVAFQFHQQFRLAAPALPGAGQGAEQQVVDLGAVGRRRLAQQLAGAVGIQLQVEGDGIAGQRRAVDPRAGEFGLALAELGAPPGQLRGQFVGLRVML
ncbi:hypothetical protein D9M68_345280 [compost metagenome]